MFNELSPTIVLPSSRQVAAEHGGPLAWRLALPLIGSASVGLWILIGKTVAFLIA